VLFRPPSSCLAKGKLDLLLRGQTNAGGVSIVSLLGGLSLHAFLAPSPLASRCESVSDVLALLCCFSVGLDGAGGALLFLCSCWSSLFSFLFQVGLFVPPRLRGSPKVA
jgi:hypothetical protein